MVQRKRRKKIILGITGSFGSGKSTVAAIFKSYGAKIIDADRISHSIISPGSKIYKKIVATFGPSILRKDRRINRDKLAKIAFSDKALLKSLNKILHPEILRIIKKKIRTLSSKIIVLDAPLLIETGLTKLADKIIVVKIKRSQQLKRIQKKTFLDPADILKRIRFQLPLSKKIRLADFIIDNSGTIEKTKNQAAQIRRLLWKS
ncbi:MAG: dephospho-CoA kinase [Candidatus Omnitrophica bacterium]|nr:dephospho-CoA kinase [Candidatus Omnitrophota bacterium]